LDVLLDPALVLYETEEEYFLSKALFMKFVALRRVREILGFGVGEAIIKFARESVVPHEERMAYFKRHDLFHLKTHTNCGHKKEEEVTISLCNIFFNCPCSILLSPLTFLNHSTTANSQ
jgi:hypothetical protein